MSDSNRRLVSLSAETISVAKDLPEKLEQTIYCDLEPAQRKLYDELREHYRSSLLGRVARDGIKKSKIQAAKLVSSEIGAKLVSVQFVFLRKTN